jgi:hypothetical protein
VVAGVVPVGLNVIVTRSPAAKAVDVPLPGVQGLLLLAIVHDAIALPPFLAKLTVHLLEPGGEPGAVSTNATMCESVMELPTTTFHVPPVVGIDETPLAHSMKLGPVGPVGPVPTARPLIRLNHAGLRASEASNGNKSGNRCVQGAPTQPT